MNSRERVTQSTVSKAIAFAVRAHSGQFRKGTGIPYVVHPLYVGVLLIESGCEEELVIAGFLHDIVEDTDVNLEGIRELFGDSIAELVQAVSEPDKSAPWETRKQHTLSSLETATQEVLLLSLADKLDNIRSIYNDLQREGEGLWQRFNRNKEAQAWYYHGLDAVLTRKLKGDVGKRMLREFHEFVEQVFPKLVS
jgi:(p)ppGpp synthase/HD superfamily hydrolase